MAQIIKVNGDGGATIETKSLTLAAGTIATSTIVKGVTHISITENGAAASGDAYAWSISGAVLTIDSSNGSSTEDITVAIFGY
jgi:hypothetical protein